MAATELLKTILINNTNLKAYYRFSSGALTTDSSGNGYTLTNYNSVGEGTGVFGGAADLGASNTNKTLYLNSDWGVAGNSNMTAVFWVKLQTEISSGNYDFYFHTSTSGADRYVEFRYEYNAGTRRMVAYTSGTAATYNITLGTSNWYHMAYVRDVTNSVARVYINGAHVASSALGSTTNGTNISGWGSNVAGGASYASCLFDDAAVFNTVLSPDQIKELYEGRTVGELWPQSELVGLWHLNGNSTDFSGNNNHGTDTAITYSQANGKFGQGAGFNGSSSKIMVTDSASISLTGSYTLSCWLKPTALPTSGNFMNPLSKYDTGAPGGAGGYEIQLYNNSGTQQINIDHYNSGGSPTLITNYTLSTSTWNYLVITWDGTNFALYVNGALVNSGRTSGVAANPLDNAKSLNIGTFGSLGGTSELGRWYNGAIDELAIYNVAKDANWVRKQYALGVGKYL